MSHPLPSKPAKMSGRRIADLVARRQQRPAGLGVLQMRMDFSRYLSLLLLFLLGKAGLLLLLVWLMNTASYYLDTGQLDNVSTSWLACCVTLAACILLLLATRHTYTWLKARLTAA